MSNYGSQIGTVSAYGVIMPLRVQTSSTKSGTSTEHRIATRTQQTVIRKRMWKMNENLARFRELAESYLQDAEGLWTIICSRSGAGGLDQWRERNLPLRGKLPGEPALAYRFHSERPELLIRLDDGREIDLIFKDGNLGSFDLWRLQVYVRSFTDRFPEFRDDNVLRTAVMEAEEAGLIIASDWTGVFSLASNPCP